MKGIVYKFNPSASTTEGQAKATREYAIMEKLERGEKVDVGELTFFSELWNPKGYLCGVVRCMGWLYDFRPYMKRYLVHDKYYGWREIYSLNKTAIRKLSCAPSHILEIVEIPNRDKKIA